MTRKQHTAGAWRFERMESAEEFAALKGETLAEHEGFYRDNNGDWIVTWKGDDGDGGRIAGVSFQGTAKRGQQWNAPDPEGQANAHLIASAPDLLEALEGASEMCATYATFIKEQVAAADLEQHPYLPALEGIVEAARAAIAKARGEQP